MGEEKMGMFSSKKKKEEPKVMIEPESKLMEEPTPLAEEEPEKKVKTPAPAAKEPAPVAPPVAKTMLDSHPTAKLKHQSIMSQRAVGARKYLKSK